MYECCKCGKLFSINTIIQRKPTRHDFICRRCWMEYYPEEAKAYIKRMPNDSDDLKELELELRNKKINKIKNGITTL
jgi:recombinational DNA repair protein (RecF pathway)